MAEISKEALLQLSARGYKEAVEFVSYSAEYWVFERRFEEIEHPTKDDNNDRHKIRGFVYGKLSELQSISEAENTKPVLAGMGSMSFGKALHCVLAFADTHYSADKLKSFKGEE
jgi:hypothetical protein